MELLGMMGTGCSQEQTSVFPMDYSILRTSCSFPGVGSTTGNDVMSSADEMAQPATWRALFSVDQITNSRARTMP